MTFRKLVGDLFASRFIGLKFTCASRYWFIAMETVNKQREVQELETILYELNTVKKNAKVYKQQQNSNVYFLTHVGLLKSEVQSKSYLG
ncbi:hypothetical protein X975_26965, partial [Stegodyphus mimosarum]